MGQDGTHGNRYSRPASTFLHRHRPRAKWTTFLPEYTAHLPRLADHTFLAFLDSCCTFLAFLHLPRLPHFFFFLSSPHPPHFLISSTGLLTMPSYGELHPASPLPDYQSPSLTQTTITGTESFPQRTWLSLLAVPGASLGRIHCPRTDNS